MNKILILLIAVMAACTNGAHDFEVAEEAAMVEEIAGDFGRSAQSKMAVASDGMNQAIAPRTSQNQPQAEITQKLIKNGNIQFETLDLEKSIQSVKQLVSSFGGYVSSESEESWENRINYNVTIRVATENFDSLMNSLSADAYKVDFKRMNIQDVTEQYYDLTTRIESQKEIEKRYLELLKQARTVKDMLGIEENLGQIRTEIEAKEGRLKVLQNRISYSTIHLNVYQELEVEFRPGKQPNFGQRILESLYNGWRSLQSFVIWVIGMWPFFLIFTLAWFGFKKIQQKLRNRKS
ncbi:MAG: DUF4349 domain-containing protein [Cyclobacteriaceae bacterium]